MQYRRQSPYPLTPRPSSSFSNPHRHSNKTSHRCKLFLALAAFVLFGVLFRNRESKFRPPHTTSSSSGMLASAGSPGTIRQISMMEKADRLYQRYLAFNPEPAPMPPPPLPPLPPTPAKEGGEEEDELFNELLALEQHKLHLHKSNDADSDELEGSAIQQMMREGVVEHPGAEASGGGGVGGNGGTRDGLKSRLELVQEEAVLAASPDRIVLIDDEGDELGESSSNTSSSSSSSLAVSSSSDKPSEQLHSEAAVVVDPTPQVDAEEEIGDEDEEDEDSNFSLSHGNSSSPLFKSNHIRGHLTYKMVNNHFLSLMDAFKHAGWSRVQLDSSANLFLTKPVTPVVGSMGKMISQISRSSCIGGTKGGQLSCRSKFARHKLGGCDFDSLEISPKQYDMWRSEDCTRFFDYALQHPDKQWIGKVGASYHGRKITLYTGVSKAIKHAYGKCRMNQATGGGYIMMEYVSKPALLDKRKFDMRTFLLIADTKPFLVFYHNGFVRRSANAYSDNLKDKMAHITNVEEQGTGADHFMGFAALQTELTNQLGFPADFLHRVFEPRAKWVTNYVFQSARAAGLKRRTGAFGLFGLDWMIDMDRKVHLLEGNGNPVVQHYPGTGELTPRLWRDMASLLTRLHMDSRKLPLLGPLKQGFKFDETANATEGGGGGGSWELVFSELEELARNRPYNACDASAGGWVAPPPAA